MKSKYNTSIIHYYCCVCGEALAVVSSKSNHCGKCSTKYNVSKTMLRQLDTRVLDNDAKRMKKKLIESTMAYDTQTGKKIDYGLKDKVTK